MKDEKLRYAILKEIKRGNKDLTEQLFGVTEEIFDNNTSFLIRENYLFGVFYSDDRPQFNKTSPGLTEKGERYLSDNSKWSKGYDKLKELRDWIKL